MCIRVFNVPHSLVFIQYTRKPSLACCIARSHYPLSLIDGNSKAALVYTRTYSQLAITLEAIGAHCLSKRFSVGRNRNSTISALG